MANTFFPFRNVQASGHQDRTVTTISRHLSCILRRREISKYLIHLIYLLLILILILILIFFSPTPVKPHQQARHHTSDTPRSTLQDWPEHTLIFHLPNLG